MQEAVQRKEDSENGTMREVKRVDGNIRRCDVDQDGGLKKLSFTKDWTPGRGGLVITGRRADRLERIQVQVRNGNVLTSEENVMGRWKELL